jgi:hypothetical protein
MAGWLLGVGINLVSSVTAVVYSMYCMLAHAAASNIEVSHLLHVPRTHSIAVLVAVGALQAVALLLSLGAELRTGISHRQTAAAQNIVASYYRLIFKLHIHRTLCRV